MKKVFIPHASQAYINLFEKLGFSYTSDIKQADLVCFTGGADVTPALYGDAAHKFTGNDVARDQKEQDIFDMAVVLDIPMVGICRGGQFLNVMNGGRMFQHVEKHAVHDGHMITDVESGREIYVSSTHHQMMMPAEDAVLIAYSTLGGGREWYDGHIFKRDISNTDYEVLFYAKTNSLCFQPHPEFTALKYEGMVEYFASLLTNKLKV